MIPTFDNPRTVREVVVRVRAHLDDVVVVDDGSGSEGRDAVAAIGRDGLAHVTHRDQNGGKGAAVKTGLAFAERLGFTHALQVDADGQHALGDIPRFLDASRACPDALVLGQPRFDATAPWGRRMGRAISVFWARLEVGSDAVGDPLCGFRVYPIVPALRVQTRGNRMDFDPEIAVRLAWAAIPIVKIATEVRYLSRADGGVSHFGMLGDNLLIARMHARLVTHRVWCSTLRVPLLPAPRENESSLR